MWRCDTTRVFTFSEPKRFVSRRGGGEQGTKSEMTSRQLTYLDVQGNPRLTHGGHCHGVTFGRGPRRLVHTVNSGTHTVSVGTCLPTRTTYALDHRTRAANPYSHDVHKRPLTATYSGYFRQHAVAHAVVHTRGHVTLPDANTTHHRAQAHTAKHAKGQSSQAQPTPEAATHWQSPRPIPHALCCQH